jgi:hypothetical protein
MDVQREVRSEKGGGSSDELEAGDRNEEGMSEGLRGGQEVAECRKRRKEGLLTGL